MSNAMIIAIITGVIGPVITILLTHYLQKRKKNGEHSSRVVVETQQSEPSSTALETSKTEDRMYYDQRVNDIVKLAAKRSAALKKGSVVKFFLPIVFGVFIGFAMEHILKGVAVWFVGLCLASLAHTAELYVSKKDMANDISLSKLDRTALFEVKTRIENTKGIYPELSDHMAQTIDQELKTL